VRRLAESPTEIPIERFKSFEDGSQWQADGQFLGIFNPEDQTLALLFFLAQRPGPPELTCKALCGKNTLPTKRRKPG
jgi:hypothetical protein